MKGVIVSIDRIVIDFTDVYWDFFNEFHKRICHFYGVRMTVGEKRSRAAMPEGEPPSATRQRKFRNISK